MRVTVFFCLCVLCLIFISCTHYKKRHTFNFQTNSQTLSSDKTTKDLSLFPINTFRFRLSELENMKGIIFFMRDRHCPLSEKYGDYIARLEEKYSQKGIKFIYNYVGQKNPQENAKKDLKKFGFKGPYLIDSRQTVINALSAQTVEEIFILTPEREIIYRGPIDNQHYQPIPSTKISYVLNIFKYLLSGKRQITPSLQRTSDSKRCTVSQTTIKTAVFWNDIAPIIQKKCANCHNPSGPGPIDYLSYEDVVGRKSMFQYVIENDLMPPWMAHSHTVSFKNDMRLTPHEKTLLMKWLRTGLKRKTEPSLITKNKTPKKRSYKIKNPDYIIKPPEKIRIKSSGFMPYKNFTIKTHFPEDKWIKEMEFIIKPKSLHHIEFEICNPNKLHNKVGFCRNHNARDPQPLKQKYFARRFSWVPGRENFYVLPNNAGIKIPKNAEIMLQLHYEPTGKETIDDMTEIRLKLYKRPPKNQQVSLILRDTSLKIPPETPNYKNELTYHSKQPLLLIGAAPHMHLRGKASSVLIIKPDGRKKTIFSVDPFNFKFQSYYRFKRPIKILKNTTLKCVNWFDNSSENPVNPDSKRMVPWGPLTKDEMSVCGFIIVMSRKYNL